MKTIKQLTILAAALTLAAGCNTDEIKQDVSAEGTPVKFDMTAGSLTKTSTSDGTAGNRAVSWRNGDAVGILVNDEAAVHSYAYDAEGDGTWHEATAADAIYAVSGQTYNFYAYYPYTTDVVTAAATTLTATVRADQNALYAETGNSGYDISDVLIASASGVTYDQAVDGVTLAYDHAFAMVEVLVSGSDVTAAPTAVRLKNIVPTASIDLINATVTTSADAVKGDITMCAITKATGISEGSYLYRAIVPAQTIANGNTLLEIDGVGDVATYVFKAPASGVTYEQGKYRRIEATIGEGAAGLTFPAGSIDSWTPSDELDPVPGEEKKVDLIEGHYIADLTAETFKVVESGPNTCLFKPTNSAYVNETCWVFAKNTEDPVDTDESAADINAELVTDAEGNYIKLSGPCSTWSWSRSALSFHYIFDPETFEVGYYRLTFKAKTEEALSKDPVIFVHTSNSKHGNGLFMMHNTTSAYPYRSVTPTTAWTEFTLYFNLAKAKNTVYSTEEIFDLTVADYEYNQLDIAFLPLRNKVTDADIKGLYIKDVTFVKVTEAEFNGKNAAN